MNCVIAIDIQGTDRISPLSPTNSVENYVVFLHMVYASSWSILDGFCKHLCSL